MAGIQRHAAPRLHAEGPARPRGHAVLRVDALLLRLLLQLPDLHRLQLQPHPGTNAPINPLESTRIVSIDPNQLVEL